MDKKQNKCSLCGDITHNKRTCPTKPIEDTFVRGDFKKYGGGESKVESTKEEYIEEKIHISPKKEQFIADLAKREEWDIEPSIFKMWLFTRRPCPLKEVRYVMDQGFSKPSIQLYLDICTDINELY